MSLRCTVCSRGFSKKDKIDVFSLLFFLLFYRLIRVIMYFPVSLFYCFFAGEYIDANNQCGNYRRRGFNPFPSSRQKSVSNVSPCAKFQTLRRLTPPSSLRLHAYSKQERLAHLIVIDSIKCSWQTQLQ